MQRVLILGQPGAGKSTLARLLAGRSGLPVEHLDRVLLLSGRVPRPMDDTQRIATEIAARDQWIVEGNYPRLQDIFVPRADTVIWLDLPVGLRLWRLYRRTARFAGQQRPDMPDDCPDRFGLSTLPFWRFVWRTRASGRTRHLDLFAHPPPHLTVLHLQTPDAVRRFGESLAK